MNDQSANELRKKFVGKIIIGYNFKRWIVIAVNPMIHDDMARIYLLSESGHLYNDVYLIEHFIDNVKLIA